MLHYARNRGAEHPERHLATYSDLMQADAYSGYNGLYVEGCKPGTIIEAACWEHGRRKFFELADLQKAPVAIEATRRIDALFAIEREINGKSPTERHAVRQERSKPLVDALKSGAGVLPRAASRAFTTSRDRGRRAQSMTHASKR